MKAGENDKHVELRQKVNELGQQSENFLRRIECALRVPYDYASARQDYETVLRQIADLEAICERRSIGGVNSEMGARSPQEYLATAKKEKEKLDRDYERIAAAAAAAARGRQP